MWGVIIQFALNDPKYKIVNKELCSLRVLTIKNIIESKYKKDVSVRISKNCLEGKIIFRENIPL